ncbi:hypothetical protein M3A49_21745 [Paraburkholderia sp. CNPSo 3076]|uniref:hypothetical protein n=1 Tax=Paraburkholderia sp. CNPSo 3076 TaxID=2940936 RepID=UPI00225331C8|nr:hypothetical protein [Paraburkholderia sp. CNPSo 3076]MCX5542101.1 hypothetical protein [Paraburkholderia sp. CNPSo 3076]
MVTGPRPVDTVEDYLVTAAAQWYGSDADPFFPVIIARVREQATGAPVTGLSQESFNVSMVTLLSTIPVVVANMEEALPGNALGLFAGTYVMSLTPPQVQGQLNLLLTVKRVTRVGLFVTEHTGQIILPLVMLP